MKEIILLPLDGRQYYNGLDWRCGFQSMSLLFWTKTVLRFVFVRFPLETLDTHLRYENSQITSTA